MSESIALRHAASTIIFLESIIRKQQEEIENGGGGGGGNAIVSENAPIQPVQAYVDNISKFYGMEIDLILSDQGITYLNPNLIEAWLYFRYNSSTLDLSGNSLTSANINAIIAAFIVDDAGSGVLDISGALMEPPTGQALLDIVYLESNAWIITVNP